MIDLFSKLSDTPIPNVLVISGIIFLLLAVAGKVGANLSIPPNRQKTAALIGSILLTGGIAMFVVPSSSTLNGDQQKSIVKEKINSNQHQKDTTSNEFSVQDQKNQNLQQYRSEDNIRQAIKYASTWEISAKRHLDISILEGYYVGEALKNQKFIIGEFKRQGLFPVCEVNNRKFHNVNFLEDKDLAYVDVTEVWNCAYYSIDSGNCANQYEQADTIRQTIILRLKESGWMISAVNFNPSNVESSMVPCKNIWPSNIKFK
ncbi:hypothetical protein LOH54_06865 [Sulfurimonas sp. HSL-3221]|uniref:hypothetical protein n=1 Tax=Sulfurimonadaceae TaxID=2771471 RepID=UPI001E353A4D|nr:hypothetical protein [Sulfurimonas sp. HSL-3221]UFS61380.1 hypothetical protein LOH54_06865 [Sulfurimonas sp. HSL-3221]